MSVENLLRPEAKFVASDSGIGSSYRPARLHRLEGRYDNPLMESPISTMGMD